MCTVPSQSLLGYSIDSSSHQITIQSTKELYPLTANNLFCDMQQIWLAVAKMQWSRKKVVSKVKQLPGIHSPKISHIMQNSTKK